MVSCDALRAMATPNGTSEIVESLNEGLSSGLNGQCQNGKSVSKYTIEDDINKLFEAIGIPNSRRALGQSEHGAKDAIRKSALKRPMRVGYTQAAGIGISESVSLKQALRGLCISQAAEMAAMKKRMCKPSGLSDAGPVKRLYNALVVESNESGHPINLGRGSLVEISIVPERNPLNSSDKSLTSYHQSQPDYSESNTESPTPAPDELIKKEKVVEALAIGENVSLSARIGCEHLGEAADQIQKLKQHSLNRIPSNRNLQVIGESIPTMDQVQIASEDTGKQEKRKSKLVSCSSALSAGSKPNKPLSSTSRLMRPVFRSRSLTKKKLSTDSNSRLAGPGQQRSGLENHLSCSIGDVACQTLNSTKVRKGCSHVTEVSPISTSTSTSMEVNLKLSASISTEVSSKLVDSSSSKTSLNSLFHNKNRSVVIKPDERSRSRQKGDVSQSSKSSVGDYSSTTSFSEESQLSGASRSGSRPHMSKDVRWEAIYSVKKQHGNLGFRHFKLLKKLGGGDIGTVYLSELVGTNCLFAVKVMDNEFLADRRKIGRALIEKEILEILDHPFLPTLYAHFTTDRFSCLVMEYCPGGDLHVLRQRQHSKCFTEQAARFYVAEVLLALEYLHMLGVVYRDLKPENVLVREDGHIMLTDFDLSLRCAVHPTLLKSSSLSVDPPNKMTSTCSQSSCIDPFCLNPSWQVSCFTSRFLSSVAKNRKLKPDIAAQVSPLPQLVVEPTSARSNSFVGTHEYLAPEIIKGEGHGSAVDWWTLGIFLYELLFGKTPFKGASNEDTLANVVSVCLKFPESPMVSSYARDLIRRLLQKEPENRLGSQRGAAEIKQHPFFEGLNFALIRCATPPELPEVSDHRSVLPEAVLDKKERAIVEHKNFKSTGVDIVFDMF